MTLTKTFISSFLIFFLVLTFFPYMGYAADTPNLWVQLNKDSFYIKGENIIANAYSNMTITVNLCIYWNWKSFSDNQLIYNNTQTTNATWTLPTTIVQVGYYRFEFSGANKTITIWTTLVHFTTYISDALPFNYEWQGVNYTLQGRHFYAQSNGDWLNLTYPKIPVNYNVNFLRNNMTFLIRLTGLSWAVDVCYMALYLGVKWTINGTLKDPVTFEFECAQNPLGKWKRTMEQWQSQGYLVFSWEDIKKATQTFDWNEQTHILSVNIPNVFIIDPALFTDGFESGNFSAWTSTAASGGDSIVVENVNPHCGTYNAKAIVTTVNGWAYASKTGLNSDPTFVRGYVKLGSNFLNSDGTNLQLLRLESADDSRWVAAAIHRTDATHIYWQLSDSSGDNLEASPSNPVAGTWYCIEIRRDSANNKAQMWVDGVDILGGELASYQPGTTDEVMAGMPLHNDVGTTTVYTDCIVVNDAYIGLEVTGLNEFFYCYQNINVYGASYIGIALSFQTTNTILAYSSAYMWKAFSYQATETIHIYDLAIKSISIAFQAIEVIKLWDSASMSKTTAMIIFETYGLIQIFSDIIMSKELAFSPSNTIKVWDSYSMANVFMMTFFEALDIVHVYSYPTSTHIFALTLDVAVGIGVLALVLAICGISLTVLRRRRN